MVQEGAAAVAQSAAAKKKKNKSKNKKKTGGQAAAAGGASSSGQPQLVKTESEERSRSSSETAPAVASPPACTPVVDTVPAPVAVNPEPGFEAAAVRCAGKSDLISNLAKEVSDHVAKFGNWAEIRDAEKLYYQHLTKTKVWTFLVLRSSPCLLNVAPVVNSLLLKFKF